MKPYLGPLYLTLAASIWGGMYVVSKVVLTFVPPLSLVWIRYSLAILFLGVMGISTKQNWQIKKADWPVLVVIGLVGYALSIWAQFAGTKLSSAQMGSVITSATPAFMVVFGALLLKERITIKKGIAVVLATIGVLFIVGLGDFPASYRLGGLFLLLAALSWALMSVLVKLVPGHYSQLVVTTYAMLVAYVSLTPFVWPQLLHFDFLLLTQPLIVAGLLYLGIVATAGAFFFWNRGLQMMDATKAGIYFFFQPLVGTLFGWLFLGEQIGWPFGLGTALIVIAVYLTMRD